MYRWDDERIRAYKERSYQVRPRYEGTPRWGTDLYAMRALAEETLHALSQNTKNEQHDALMEAVWMAVDAIAAMAREAHLRYAVGPASAFNSGQQLSREEYLIVQAIAGESAKGTPSNKSVGLSEWDDYEVYSMFLYEDDERYCYINPSLDPLPPPSQSMDDYLGAGRLTWRFGAAPENLCLDALRPERHRFFRKHLPEVYRRFNRRHPEDE